MLDMGKRKTGIITYFYYFNYGTMLQAYALMRAIKSIDNISDCEIIDYRFGEKNKSRFQMFKIRIRRLFVYLTTLNRVIKIAAYKDKMGLRRKYFEAFLRANIRLSSNTYMYNVDLEENPPKYDVYITGSDQTWSPKIGFNPALFLNFANPVEAVLGAYAPSIGVTSFTNEQKRYLRKNIVKYDFVSCRETLGAKMLEEVTQREVKRVLDPTLLITKEQWRELEKPVQNIELPYILCYFLGDREYYRRFVTQLHKQTGLPIYYIPVSYVDFKKSNNLLFETGPSEFLYLIDKASIVCTDSFHGLAFCSNFNKDFYAFVKHEGAVDSGDNSRIYDYLQRIKLTDRLISKYDGERIDILPIDYSATNEILEQERIISKDYLASMLTFNKDC